MILPLKLSILELSEILMYEFWYDYVKPKHDGKQNSVIGCTKTDDIYKDIAEDVETIFDTSNFELDGPLPKGKKSKSNWINKIWVRWKNDDKVYWVKRKNL